MRFGLSILIVVVALAFAAVPHAGSPVSDGTAPQAAMTGGHVHHGPDDTGGKAGGQSLLCMTVCIGGQLDAGAPTGMRRIGYSLVAPGWTPAPRHAQASGEPAERPPRQTGLA